MTSAITISSAELLADIKSAAWLESELHPDSNLHRRHEIADICEKDNIERVWRIFGICMAEVRVALKTLLSDRESSHLQNDLDTPDAWTMTFRNELEEHTGGIVKEKIHEYMVARVLADRLGVIIPEAAEVWRSSAGAAFAYICDIANNSRHLYPVRRPMTPF